MKDNIILIGMPGSGKSTVGVLLAKALGYQFLDTDLIISAQRRMTLQKIIDRYGLEFFLSCEEQAGLSVNTHQTVIATGGSMVLGEQAMEHFRNMGTVVYLDVPLETLVHRVRNMRTRGIAARPGETLQQIYETRVPYYQKYADLQIAVSDRESLEDTVADAMERLREN